MSFFKYAAKSFDTNGTEGMLDVILGCTLVFILLSSLIQVEHAEAQETALPAMDLTRTESKATGASRIRKTTVSIKNADGKMQLFLDNKAVSAEDLKKTLGNLKNLGYIALRRDRNVPCGWEDKIMLLCQDSGVDHISIVMKNEK